MANIDISKFHQSAFIIDAHCDTVGYFEKSGYNFAARNQIGQVDLPRLAEAGVKLQFFAIFEDMNYKPHGALNRALSLISFLCKEIEKNSDRITLVTSFTDIQRINSEGKIGAFISLEGADPLDGGLEILEIFKRVGVRAIGLTWNNNNQFAAGADEEDSRKGITNRGKELIRQLNEHKLLIDLAHISSTGFFEALEISEKPVIVSHANAYKLCPNKRNLNDSQLKSLRDKRGVIGLTFYPPFIKEKGATLDALMDHAVYIAGLIGVEHLGIGSDFDGVDLILPELKDVTSLPTLTAMFFRRGFSGTEIKKILGGNILRLLKETIA